MFLPDTNIWLALVFEAHAMHPSVGAWFQTMGRDSCRFCRITQSGFLRLATNPSVVGSSARSMEAGWQLYDTLLTDSRIGFSEEPSGTEHLWRARTYTRAYSPKVWTDAYLAAFAEAGALTLVTLDRALARTEGNRAICLS